MFKFLSKKGISIVSPTDGNLLKLEEVKDAVFSQKMMGDGYAIEPSSDVIYSPVSGKISSVFPTKHAIGIISDEGLEILLHLGIDTVELEGIPFSLKKSKGNHILKNEILATMDRKQIKDSDKEATVIVIFTNMNQVNNFKLINQEVVKHGDVVVEIDLRKR